MFKFNILLRPGFLFSKMFPLAKENGIVIGQSFHGLVFSVLKSPDFEHITDLEKMPTPSNFYGIDFSLPPTIFLKFG